MSTRLAQALRDAIERGALRCGARLPPERALAYELIISRGTVSTAYQALRESGLVETRERGRTAVVGADGYRGFASRRAEVRELNNLPLSYYIMQPPGHMIDFVTASSRPIPGFGGVAQALFADFEASAVSRLTYTAMGVSSLRERIAEYYSRSGCPTTVANVIVMSGAQQAIATVLKLVISPGDTVLCEDPCYPGAALLLEASFARSHAISLDDEGLSLQELEHFTERGGPNLLFFSPSFNSPTGRLTSMRRRQQIVELCSRVRLPILEDNSLAELGLGETVLHGIPHSLSAIDGDAEIFSVGSLDKSVWSGLRIGWIRAPERYIRRFGELKTLDDLTTSLPSQLIAEQFIFAHHEFELRREALRSKLAVLEGALAEYLPDWHYERPDGGQVLWVDIGTDARRFAQTAERCGVRVGIGPQFTVTDRWKNYLRIPFGQAEATELVEGVKRLARAAQEFEMRRESVAG
jgi:DNA-binding transcriptional MocR family regulator